MILKRDPKFKKVSPYHFDWYVKMAGAKPVEYANGKAYVDGNGVMVAQDVDGGYWVQMTR